MENTITIIRAFITNIYMFFMNILDFFDKKKYNNTDNDLDILTCPIEVNSPLQLSRSFDSVPSLKDISETVFVSDCEDLSYCKNTNNNCDYEKMYDLYPLDNSLFVNDSDLNNKLFFETYNNNIYIRSFFDDDKIVRVKYNSEGADYDESGDNNANEVGKYSESGDSNIVACDYTTTVDDSTMGDHSAAAVECDDAAAAAVVCDMCNSNMSGCDYIYYDKEYSNMYNHEDGDKYDYSYTYYNADDDNAYNNDNVDNDNADDFFLEILHELQRSEDSNEIDCDAELDRFLENMQTLNLNENSQSLSDFTTVKRRKNIDSNFYGDSGENDYDVDLDFNTIYSNDIKENTNPSITPINSNLDENDDFIPIIHNLEDLEFDNNEV